MAGKGEGGEEKRRKKRNSFPFFFFFFVWRGALFCFCMYDIASSCFFFPRVVVFFKKKIIEKVFGVKSEKN